MAPSSRGPRLPNSLLATLGDKESGSQGGKRRKIQTRKDLRKEERKNQKAKRHRNGGRPGRQFEAEPIGEDSDGSELEEATNTIAHSKMAKASAKPEQSTSINTRASRGNQSSGSIPRERNTREARIAQDDAEIALLEKKLGLKGRKSLPKSFHEDGLGDLLDGLEGGRMEYGGTAAKRKAEADDFLAQKRRKAVTSTLPTEDDTESGSDSWSGDEGEDTDGGDEIVESEGSYGSAESWAGLDETPEASERNRENPYVPPVTTQTSDAKYIPPAQRRQVALASDDMAVDHLQRKVHGLLNRLTEDKLLPILSDTEGLYRDHPRQIVTDVLARTILSRVGDEGNLQDTVFTLTAAFATALYKVAGIDFGAHLVQATVSQMKDSYGAAAISPTASPAAARVTVNLVTFLTELYNFKMIGCSLIFDYIRRLLDTLSEFNTELLLRIIRTSGWQLRRDDPGALKEIVALIPSGLSRTGDQGVSVRTRFMIDTINDLKNNKKTTGSAILAPNREYTTRMRKMLGTLQSRSLESTEPLGMGLKDIEESDKRGKWWLVGAHWAGATGQDGTAENSGPVAQKSAKRPSKDDEDKLLGSWSQDMADISELENLAREQGMNTAVRRSIFVALMSAADCKHAQLQLMKLGLTKHDKADLCTVLVRCVGAEEKYNPYYALVAAQSCSDRNVLWAFQHTLWQLFSRLGEPIFEDEAQDDDENEDTDLLRLAKVARMYGFLIAKGRMELKVLRRLELAYLQSKTRSFVEVMVLSLLRDCIRQDKGGMDGVRRVFRTAAADVGLARGLRRFLRKVVNKSELIEKSEAKRMTRACDAAVEGLDKVTATQEGGEGAEPEA